MIEKDDFFAGDDDAEFEEKPKIMREANYMDDVDVINGKRKQEVYQEIEKTKEYAENPLQSLLVCLYGTFGFRIH
eukprot:CAMPEP_0114596826 /NCGR_PEP_ID=MMETSP0125-20121206/19007_1 /TAXON_ID=485358 ORGANISM="Aristerostoma sp., Strain ATCC 50986" /NCGR_SAMPLE_ID=MMETSP0125 /ASSEMBLY_ACC=CAM_ASM_000245 /LENGTH=74 /DNA_ID=CAMNT_0001800567 /DNA_START=726 /DNA_END=950 /DNA_ORIENTATION=+